MQCDMCGKDTVLLRAMVEGTELKVCEKCSKYGKVLGRLSPAVSLKKEKHKQAESENEPEIVQIIVPDYNKKIKSARESMGLKQEEIAAKINERESLINKIESGHQKPDLALCRKLEKFFKIKLIEEQKMEKDAESKHARKPEGLTIGDLIKVRK